MMIASKIQAHHLQKSAYVYLRQSTMGQLIHHPQSTERQYALKKKAQQLGWKASLIQVLDGDLGQSGKTTHSREDFKTLVADVSMNKVGAIFVLEISRLSRSSADWHRLLELCALTDTLLLDEDGCYNPSDFNDQLVLGLKGTMSQAELHLMHSRLQGGKLNKAQKGELRFPLPVGFCFDEEGRFILDPDEEVRHVIRLLFQTFAQTRSAYGVAHKFTKQNILFPKRAYGGVWKGKLIFGRLTHSRVVGILKNPSYAGTYVYGRYGTEKKISPEGKIQLTPKKKKMEDWTVTLHNHHQGYITWEEYLENQQILKNNLTHGEGITLSGPLREGLAMLQGLLLCGTCGRRLTVRYQGNGGIYPTYECNRRARECISKSCMSLKAGLVDEAVIQRALEALQPEQVQLAIEALEELRNRQQRFDKSWELKLQRAHYETELAQRRYEAVDPDNRLVAGTLEKQWNDTLITLEKLRKQYQQYQNEDPLLLSIDEKRSLLELAKDFPKLWNAPSTEPKDKKQILRILIDDITVERPHQSKTAILHVRWKGGACEDITVTFPPKRSEQIRYPQEVIEQVRALAKTQSDKQIAETLNQQEQLSATGKPFTRSMIQWIRYKHKIPAPEFKRPHELSVNEVAQRFQVSLHVVYYWIEQKIVSARQLRKKGPYFIEIPPEEEEKLREIVQNSTKIQKLKINSSQKPSNRLK
jgi:DNA invertase Pin-like site-specific DNA recombinase